MLRARNRTAESTLDNNMLPLEDRFQSYAQKLCDSVIWSDVKNPKMAHSSGEPMCDYLAFLDEDEKSVGCLIHPMRLGDDYRNEALKYVSCWKVLTKDKCRNWNCGVYTPSLTSLVEGEFKDLFEDWYACGLMTMGMRSFLIDFGPDIVKELIGLVDKRLINPTDVAITGNNMFHLLKSWNTKNMSPRLIRAIERTLTN